MQRRNLFEGSRSRKELNLSKPRGEIGILSPKVKKTLQIIGGKQEDERQEREQVNFEYGLLRKANRGYEMQNEKKRENRMNDRQAGID